MSARVDQTRQRGRWYAGASLVAIGNLVTGLHSWNGDEVELVDNDYLKNDLL